MPRELASTTPNTAAVAIAASIALPPLMRILTPASVASGWLETTIPFLAKTENLPAINSPPRTKWSIGVQEYWISVLIHHSITPSLLYSTHKLTRFQNLRIKLHNLVVILIFLRMHYVALITAKEPGGFRFDIAARRNSLKVPELFLAFLRQSKVDQQFGCVWMSRFCAEHDCVD